MYFKTDVEQLPSQKVRPGVDQSDQSRTGMEMTNWSGGNTHPKVGHVPSLRKDCALHQEQQFARAVNGSSSLEVSMMSRSSIRRIVGNRGRVSDGEGELQGSRNGQMKRWPHPHRHGCSKDLYR